MSDILLAKPKLDNSWIDTSVGEAHVVRESLFKTFDIQPYHWSLTDKLFEYQEPQGYKPLVNLLEDKYQAPVIITNGAKNALGAMCYALKQSGRKLISLPQYYWALLPSLIEMHGLQWKTPSPCDEFDAHLLVLPNNPTGNSQYDSDFCQECSQRNIPVIHDGVYYNHIYLPSNHPLPKIGDIQIFSASKAYGLSGIRIGWAVFYNPELYNSFKYYMETMTVGVSTLSQSFIFDLMTQMKQQPYLTTHFEQISSDALTRSKQIIKEVNPNILEVPVDIETVPGMFGFFKCHQPEVFAQAKVNPAWGEPFGAPGFVRINLALPEDQMIEVVKRLNSVQEINENLHLLDYLST